jgi:hypothetical protein
MPIIVIGGAAHGSGKTALVCGLIRALPEIPWTAVKITSHAHGSGAPIWEETTVGQGTDTARYLAAGARRALLVTAAGEALAPIVHEILAENSPPASLIFESNSVLSHLRPDLCLCAATNLKGECKPSFDLIEQQMDALVELAGHDHVVEANRIGFHLASLERVSQPMLAWLRQRLTIR